MKKSPSEDAQPTAAQNGLTLVKQCPLCTHLYTEAEVRILEEESGTQLLHITCATCQHAMLTFVMTSQLGTSSIGMLTDLTVSDVLRMRDRDPISDDDVLQFHTVLHGSSSSFTHLLK